MANEDSGVILAGLYWFMCRRSSIRLVFGALALIHAFCSTGSIFSERRSRETWVSHHTEVVVLGFHCSFGYFRLCAAAKIL